MKKTALLLIITCAFLSCNRKEFKAYKGTYDCTRLEERSYPDQPAVYTLTTGNEVEVTKSGKLVEVLDLEINVDEIAPNETYTKTDGKLTYTLRFSNDSIFYYVARTELDSTVATGYYGGKIN